MTRKHILVIDDEDDIREVARMTLDLVGGMQVTTAASGAEGIAAAAEVKPDAILLDVMMPGLDGPETFRRLREQDSTRDIPVVLLTAKVQAADRKRFEDLGVTGVLTKPFDPMQLSEQVSDALGWR